MITLSYVNQILWHARVARKQIDGSPAEIQTAIESWREAANESLDATIVAYKVDEVSVGDYFAAIDSFVEAKLCLARHQNNELRYLDATYQWADMALVTWSQVNALNQAGRVGGEAVNEALARLLCEAARVQFRNASKASGKEPIYDRFATEWRRLEIARFQSKFRPTVKDWPPVRVDADDLLEAVFFLFYADRLSLDSVMTAMNYVVDANLAGSRGKKDLQTNVIPYLHGVIGKCKKLNDAGETLVATGRRPQERQLATNLWLALATLNVMAAESEGQR